MQAPLRSFPSFPSLNLYASIFCSNENDLRLYRPPDLRLTPQRYRFRVHYNPIVAKKPNFAHFLTALVGKHAWQTMKVPCQVVIGVNISV
jgi:hypothetical protein